MSDEERMAVLRFLAETGGDWPIQGIAAGARVDIFRLRGYLEEMVDAEQLYRRFVAEGAVVRYAIAGAGWDWAAAFERWDASGRDAL